MPPPHGNHDGQKQRLYDSAARRAGAPHTRGRGFSRCVRDDISLHPPVATDRSLPVTANAGAVKPDSHSLVFHWTTNGGGGSAHVAD